MFRKLVCTAAIAMSFGAAPPAIGWAGTTHYDIQIPAGKTGTSVKGKLSGYDTVEYALSAFKGQRLQVTMKTSNSSAYFNVFAPGDKPGQANAIFNGSINGSHADITLPADGRYTIQVYLMRNAARRDEKADYAFDIRATVCAATRSDTVAKPAAKSTTGFWKV